MKDAQPNAIFLKDYQAPNYWIEKTDLVFDLHEDHAMVSASLSIRLNDDVEGLPDLVLSGIDLELKSISIDGHPLSDADYTELRDQLCVKVERQPFCLEITNRIKPRENTSLEGLYLSNGMFCTQCEAEGFRKITYYLDRPDVMSVFTTTIIADKHRYPILLSNGNDVARGEAGQGRHWVKWEDPFKKPSYLFALVAGDLQLKEDLFTTMSGRDISLRIYTEAYNIDKCDHAMRSLKKSMKWDEDVYGREYDLDLFMIVAVDHFNMGAMENKGLNIFNSSCVLTSPKTATDSCYQRVEGVVGHEYFHNWSGNRVTCRDWFQLSLKEGFTVFRDSEFSADMNSRGVKRIQDVSMLRTAQFDEDSGPMAHAVRPESFIEIANFYTLTIYEKGAEVVRMIHSILGDDLFRKGSDLYFERHDGQAVTCEDFVRAMEDASGKDLTQFRLWYSQAGTPVLDVSDAFDEAAGEYTLTIKQSCPPTPGQHVKKPFHIPVRIGLLDNEGLPVTLNAQGSDEVTLDIRRSEETFTFTGLSAKPLPSLLRGFSAPVRLNYPYSTTDLIFLMQHDTDSFNRWDATQRLAMAEINSVIEALGNHQHPTINPALISAWGEVLADQSLDQAVKAEMLNLPSEASIAEQRQSINPDLIHRARKQVKRAIAKTHQMAFLALWKKLSVKKPYKPEAADIAERALKNTCLGYLVTLDNLQYLELASDQYRQSGNMTDQLAGLVAVVNAERHEQALIDTLLDDFLATYRGDANVMDQWFSVQANSPTLGTLAHVLSLMEHEQFDASSPNKVRALVGAFTRNMVQFHKTDGSGYQFLAELVIEFDRKNPQLAARLIQPLTRWKKYEENYQAPMKKALTSIKALPDLSTDVFEVVTKSLSTH